MTQADNFIPYPQSRVIEGATTFILERNPATGEKRLVIQGGSSHGFAGNVSGDGSSFYAPLTAENANAIRQRLPWLKAAALGLKTSAGTGDRLGLATPGHAAAAERTGIAMIYAQQSVRENVRTGRKPQEVMDDAMWGVFQVGWREPWGGDADHLKRVEDIPAFVEAGYTFFTVDPGDHVDQSADEANLADLRVKVKDLPWEELKTSQAQLLDSLVGKSYELEGFSLKFDDTVVLRAAVKYGRSVAHALRMYKRLEELMAGKAFDFEVSVDETATPTSIHEHFFIAHELKRLGVRWTSLAPRFVGRFEKGVDYIGDLDELDRTMGQHAAVMRYFGGYKISLHSGSDKFSVYPLAAKHCHNLVHLKTAGTSYLEALRVIAMKDPDLFKRIYLFARDRYDTDKASYHVSAELRKAPENPIDQELPDLLNQFDARQILHVTFGSVMDTFRSELYAALRKNEADYYGVLKAHFEKHLMPLKPA